MGCNSSKSKDVSRDREWREQRRTGAGQPAASAPRGIAGASAHASGQDGGIMLGTSTDHRRGEEELLRRIVTRTDANLIDINEVTYELEGQNPYELTKTYRASVAHAPVAERAILLFNLPAVDEEHTWDVVDLLSRAPMSLSELQAVSRSADGLAEAFSQIRVNDRGQRVVVPISA